MPSFQDSAVLLLLALLLFGPKKLPVLARQLGKLMADFRRASNEFRTQMEEELRISEQAERQKQIAALDTSTPPSPTIDTPATSEATSHDTPPATESHYDADSPIEYPAQSSLETAVEAPVEATPTPIAVSGDLSILPPSTGLPTASSSANGAEPLTPHQAELETEILHG
jgi:sec-independent protein translocase protein TatB